MTSLAFVARLRILVAASLALVPGCVPSPGSFGEVTPSSAVFPGDGGWIGAYRSGTHSHNDFDRRRPLVDALSLGFASVEVDVALRDGVFYVTHDSSSIRTDRTFTGMYLDPLQALVRARGGAIYPSPAPPLQLLIDVKSDAGVAYRALDDLLARYPEVFTRWTRGQVTRGPVSAVLSGRRAHDLLRDDPDRFVALDGRIWEDRSGVSVDIMPLVSINWDDTMGPGGRWDTSERMTNAARYVGVVHAEGRRVRFWGTPDQAGLWSALLSIGVDYLGADDIRRLARFAPPDRPPGPPTAGIVGRP